MNNKLRITQSWYRIFEIVACHLAIIILLPLVFLWVTNSIESIIDMPSIVLLIFLVFLPILSLIIAILGYKKENWVIENQMIIISKTTLGFGMKVTRLPLNTIKNVSVNRSYAMRLWPYRDLHINYTSLEGKGTFRDISLSPNYSFKMQVFIKEYAEAIQNNKEFNLEKEFSKI